MVKLNKETKKKVSTRKIACLHCGHVQMTKTKLDVATCSNCGFKIKVRK